MACTKSVSEIKQLIEKLKAQGAVLSDVAWQAALACVGDPYVYGAVGEECRPAKRRQYGAKFYLKGHETIVTKCKALSWDNKTNTCVITGNCEGCKWNLPVMMFDCRGFTRKLFQMVFSFTLWGGTVKGQWDDDRNWKAKGEIADMPRDTLCCLFVYDSKKKKWMHTGLGLNDETVEASSGVQHFTKRNKKWTHWAVPKCVEGDVPMPTNPTLKKGSKGEYVTKLQTLLKEKGYDLGKWGVDGDFGSATLAAVKAFQKANGLTVDGIVGKNTWNALLKDEPRCYEVIVKDLTESQAKALCSMYDHAEMKEVG